MLKRIEYTVVQCCALLYSDIIYTSSPDSKAVLS